MAKAMSRPRPYFPVKVVRDRYSSQSMFEDYGTSNGETLLNIWNRMTPTSNGIIGMMAFDGGACLIPESILALVGTYFDLSKCYNPDDPKVKKYIINQLSPLVDDFPFLKMLVEKTIAILEFCIWVNKKS